eukprot:jgi/Mesvir1/5462/Mv15516-RA.1
MSVQSEILIREELARLDVSCCDASGKGIIKVAVLWKQLKHLNIATPVVCKAGILEVVRVCPDLPSLNMAGLRDMVDDKVLAVLAASCRGLELLDISSCKSVTDAGIVAVAEQCKQLQHLNFRSTKLELLDFRLEPCKVTAANLTFLARNCPRLCSVSYISEGAGEYVLLAIVENCSQLEHLEFSGGSFPMDVCMAAISRNCRRLRSVKT